jgi:hypothetical protein
VCCRLVKLTRVALDYFSMFFYFFILSFDVGLLGLEISYFFILLLSIELSQVIGLLG